MDIAKEKPITSRMWTDHNQSEYAYFITHGKAVYGIRYIFPPERVFSPVNFDYRKTFREQVKKLDASRERSAEFLVFAALEKVTAADGNVIKTKYILPGPLNQIFNYNLDPTKQDTKGDTGLRIKCVIRRIDNPQPSPSQPFTA